MQIILRSIFIPSSVMFASKRITGLNYASATLVYRKLFSFFLGENHVDIANKLHQSDIDDRMICSKRIQFDEGAVQQRDCKHFSFKTLNFFVFFLSKIVCPNNVTMELSN